MNHSKDYQRCETMSVLIPDAEDWQTVKVLRCLGQESIVTSHILSKQKRPLSRFSRYCVDFHHNSSQNDSGWIKELNKLVEKLRINIILPVTLKGVELISKKRKDIFKTAAVAPLVEPEKIALANDKWAFHKFISQHGLPYPTTIYAGKAGGEIQIKNKDLSSIDFPALLKPASEAGGFGIVKIENINELEQAWQSPRIMNNHHYILQSVIPGEDICLQVFCKKGKIEAYTIQKSLSGSDNYFGPQRFMEFVMDEEVLALGERTISAIGWDGIACIDFRIDARNKKIKILEINPRFGQAILGSLIAGVNFPLIACYSALGKAYPFKYRNTRYAHPVPSAKIFVSSFFGKTTAFKNPQLSESGLKFTSVDPLPEIIDFVCRTGRRLKHKIICKRSSCSKAD